MESLEASPSSRTRLRTALLAVLCMLLWGSAFPSIKVSYALFAIEHTTPFDKIFFAGLRFTGAGVLTLLLSRFVMRRRVCVARADIPAVLGLGLLMTTAQYICFYLGLGNSSAGKSAILNAMATFFTVFLAALCLGEAIVPRKLIGCLCGFLGIVVVNLGGLNSGFTWNGDLLIILSSFCFSLGSVLSKKLTQSEDPVTLSGLQMLFGGLVLIGIGLLGGGRLHAFSPAGLALLLYMMLLSAVALSLWTTLLRGNDAASISVYFFLVPVFGVLLSGIFLRERVLTPTNMLSLLCVCAGIYIVNSASLSKRAK